MSYSAIHFKLIVRQVLQSNDTEVIKYDLRGGLTAVGLHGGYSGATMGFMEKHPKLEEGI